MSKRKYPARSFTGTLVCSSCGLEHDGTNFVSPFEGYGENQRSFGPLVNCLTYFSIVFNDRRIHIKGEYTITKIKRRLMLKRLLMESVLSLDYQKQESVM
ncbi:hypothetical protein AMTRI_Chr02g258450 [Amborella trichopoda]